MYFRVRGCRVLLFFVFIRCNSFSCFALFAREDKKAAVLQKIVSRNVGNCGTYFTIVMRNFAYR